MHHENISRRQFLRSTTLAAGAAVLSPVAARAALEIPKRTATDQVVLGKTGLKLSRLGIGTGSRSGSVQRELGHEGFNRLIRHAYDQGITYIDTAQSYRTHEWIREAIRGLPREKLFIQTKMPKGAKDPLQVIERYRKELDVDYIDSLLVHCACSRTWDEECKPLLEAFEKAMEKKLIRTKGVSCHSLPALTRAVNLDWVEVHLVRVNPQGAHVDTPAETWNATSDASHVPPVVKQIRRMRTKGHGIIGMKLIGNGDFTKPEDREKSIRFAMQPEFLDAAVIGFKSPAEIDEAIERMNRALAASRV